VKIAGFCSSHDCSYCILENGVPIVHNELERFIREKEPTADAFKFMINSGENLDEVKHFTHCFDTWNGGIERRFPDSFRKMKDILKRNGGRYYIPGHHQSHAANAFFSSNYDEALIITVDGGGRDYGPKGEMIITNFTVWEGKQNKISAIDIVDGTKLNIGTAWSSVTGQAFGLSTGHPQGNQAGTVMAMACMGEPKYLDVFLNAGLRGSTGLDFAYLKSIVDKSEQDAFDVAASLQVATEITIKNWFAKYLEKHPYKYLCLSGGVVLNSVMVGKLYEWFPELEGIYVCPVPYDAGLAIGAAQYVWHHVLDNPRINWEDNATPYLGRPVDSKKIIEITQNYSEKVKYKQATDDDVVNLLLQDGNVISVFNGGSESGRRALGNRSILADPRNPSMKNVLNEKVKHRQWFRPFAPSILRDHVKDWFIRDVDSPYMTKVIKFKDSVVDQVPAVAHYDNSARLQTVTRKDNPWYYGLIEKFYQKTGVPILLNTSFNDREPIVELPEHALDCFLKTNIDYLYFSDAGIIVEKL
tara:strand:+ start:11485 stop:13068 length:1584 start_codon:yes stop_codon:yes gene_type:complete